MCNRRCPPVAEDLFDTLGEYVSRRAKALLTWALEIVVSPQLPSLMALETTVSGRSPAL